jgi:hypothetical protein
LLGYRVYHELVPGQFVCLGDVNVEGRDDVDLAFLHDVPYDGTMRKYYVTAVNAEGESAPSPTATTVPLKVPGAPRDLGRR